jgi:predicted unusual protein kinase regulating ubiquinone biosynthesis (AarF/ABC1/UbiB family)
MSDEVSGGRFGRFVRLGWLSRRALPIAWRRLKQVSAAPSGARGPLVGEALARHADIADEAFRTLGSLKGLALKVGQMLSYLDGALPEEYRAVYQQTLARLQQQAPAVSFAAIEPLLVEDLGRPVAEAFARFEPEPFAAASIGQVHRAWLESGEAVAVKVQYPGIDRAVAADLKNVGMMKSLLLPVLGLSGRGQMAQNLEEVLGEVRARVLEELDYEHEARMQERFRALFASDDELRVPRVFAAQSGRRVLTSEYIAGRTLAEVCASAPQAERDRYGVVLTRAMLVSIYRHRLFNADPHPGNFLFPDDGRVVMLDFGCVKELPEWMVPAMKRYVRAALAGDAPEFERAIVAAFKLDPAEPEAFALYRDFILYCLKPYLKDEPFAFTAEYTGGSIDHMLNGVNKMVFKGFVPRIPNLPSVPADFTFISRLQWGFYSVLTSLRANGNWHRMLAGAVYA